LPEFWTFPDSALKIARSFSPFTDFFMRLHSRYAPILFGALLSAIMVSIVSACVILINQGTTEFMYHWIKSVITAWPVAFPAVLMVAPLVRKLVMKLTAEQPAP
jgi:hypothetical protein